ncbi:MAG TPA: hypothetical protein VIG90_08115 [Pedomonas sp.]|uniref:hypothetical protein n=1 Tax=Pedomonas sp. TaxID=2976421 RepID=UPI002F423A5D
MANTPNDPNSTPGAHFLDHMSEFMDDLSTIRTLAEKLAAKMEEMSKTASECGQDA